MAVTYAAAGIAAGLTGTLLSAALQNAWVLGAFALVFVVLSFSMFGFYELQLPTALQSKLSEESGHLQGGRGIGVFAMGALSALIVGPCVAAPLAGALLYIGQTGDAVLGGTALFVMALGMGAPLIAVGAAGGSLLPKTGPWMEGVKKGFGVLLLATAVWLLTPVVPPVVPMLAWAALLIVPAIYLHAVDPLPPHARGWQRFWKGVGIVMLPVSST
jgi:thiol:disulfide interchange protein DsbD